MGLLIDENGDKITDTSKMNFTKTLEAQVESLIGSIQRLVNALLGIPDVDYTVTEHRRTEGSGNGTGTGGDGGGNDPGSGGGGTEPPPPAYRTVAPVTYASLAGQTITSQDSPFTFNVTVNANNAVEGRNAAKAFKDELESRLINNDAGIREMLRRRLGLS